MEGKTIDSLAFKLLLAGIIAIVLVSTGREILYPVATVILGGLVSSTLLDLFRSPSSFWEFNGNAEQQVHDTYITNEFDANDHGLPPAGSIEVYSTRDKHVSVGGVFNGGTIAANDG
jgi:hypothetical protein